jgi:hypothetical protein
MATEWILQGDYGYGDGFEDLSAYDNKIEAGTELATYQANSPEGRYRIVRRYGGQSAQQRQAREARERLQAILPTVSTTLVYDQSTREHVTQPVLYTLVTHVSPSGMSRRMRVMVIRDHVPTDITRHVAHAIGTRTRGDEMIVKGAGMDVGFHVVYSLSQALNGVHGGYQLAQAWL